MTPEQLTRARENLIAAGASPDEADEIIKSLPSAERTVAIKARAKARVDRVTSPVKRNPAAKGTALTGRIRPGAENVIRSSRTPEPIKVLPEPSRWMFENDRPQSARISGPHFGGGTVTTGKVRLQWAPVEHRTFVPKKGS